MLDQMLQEAGLEPSQIHMTNVFWTRPTNNNLASLMLTASDWKSFSKEHAEFGSPTGVSPLKLDNRLHYLHPNFYPEITRLHEEISQCNPNLIVACGNTALWSLTGRQNISALRGTTLLSSTVSPPRKLLPTYHPAAVLREWSLRTIVVADLMKARIQSEFPEVRRPSRLINISPTISTIRDFLSNLSQASALAVDIETRNGQITCIGFAVSSSEALVVPFVRGFKDCYWPTAEEEVQALQLVRDILLHPVPKIFQNGLYDLQYIWRTWGIAPRNCIHDTMIKHHAMFPEMQKGLGFLGSLYTEEPAWKLMRNFKDTQEKRDDE